MAETEQFPSNFSKPPRRLFESIMERLKIEKILTILRKKISFSSAVLIFSIILIGLAFMIFKRDLVESEAIPLFPLLFSDTYEVIVFSKYFLLAFFQSIPVLFLTLVLFAISILMISLRFLVKYYYKIVELIKR